MDIHTLVKRRFLCFVLVGIGTTQKDTQQLTEPTKQGTYYSYQETSEETHN